MLFCFVSVSGANQFMTELLSTLCAAVKTAGHRVDFAFDEFPRLEEPAVYVVIPHEFYGLPGARRFPDCSQRARTIALCTENPGTEWFDRAAELIPRFGAAMAINRVSVSELKRGGIRCEHFQLGYSRLWDSWHRDETSPRPIDVLYLGAMDRRRDPILAGYGRALWSRSCEFLVPPLESRGEPRPDYLTGIDKHHRLRAARLLLNLHRTTSASMEWVRFLESACNGCVMLSEPCLDHHPLVPGEHFLVTSAASMPLLADRLLDDSDRLRRVRLDAYDYVRSELDMGPSVERLVALANDTAARALADDKPLPARPSSVPEHPLTPEAEALQTVRVAVRALGIEVGELRRAVDDMAHRVMTGEPPAIEVYARTPAFDAVEPRVTVMVTAHDHEQDVVEALSSVAASRYSDLEVLILDDASSDGSAEAAADFLRSHPWLAGMVLRHPVNRGLARSRNALVSRARGEYVFVLDADNGVYPSALARLSATLDADPQATFAYSMIAVYSEGVPHSLLSGLPWEPERLRHDNYIDAMALLRRDHLLELRGYTTDPRLAGWEDFELWCRCAETRRYGILVPQVLAWYRRREHSMLGDTQISTTRAWSLMRARFPELLRPHPAVLATSPP